MKKIHIILITVLMVFIYACERESFNYDLYEINANEVTSLTIHPSSAWLNADDKSTLTFLTDMEVHVVNNELDSLVTVTDELIPENVVTYFVDGVELTGNTYKTGDVSKTQIECYAKAGSVMSNTVTISIRPLVTYSKITVPVIFHIMNEKPNEGEMIKLDPAIFLEALVLLNRQFNRDLGYSAAGANVNIEFIPAELDPYGKTLTVPGIHEYSFKENDINEADLDTEGYPAFLNSKKLNWDYKKYLNIFISPNTKDSYLSGGRIRTKTFMVESLNKRPEYTLSDDTLQGVTLTKVTTDPGFTNADATGIFINMDSAGKIERGIYTLAKFVTKYYGLISTPTEDYCDDTYLWNASASINKGYYKFTTPDKIRFISKNAADAGSLGTTITTDQAERIRYVLENCPSRAAR